MDSPEEVFRSLVQSVSRQDWAAATKLYAEDAVVEHPKATSSSPVPR